MPEAAMRTTVTIEDDLCDRALELADPATAKRLATLADRFAIAQQPSFH
jgi:hypothetical protein